MKSGISSYAKITLDDDESIDSVATSPISKAQEKPRQARELWCERNSKPVKRPKPRPAQSLTQWQKPGPMTTKQWKNFYGWALQRALPRETQLLKAEEEEEPCARAKRYLDKNELEKRMIMLATPRKVTEKYKQPGHSPTYSPMTSWGQPPHHDPRRPFKPPHVPCCFPHADLEAEFWSQLRFPVRRAALLGQVTPRLINLSKPRIYPTSCGPQGPLDGPPPRRKKFTKKGWQHHQLRLLYLSQPVSRSTPEFYFYTECPCCAHHATRVPF